MKHAVVFCLPAASRALGFARLLCMTSKPFARCHAPLAGGLGDVMQALPKALAARGHKVMVVVPRYKDYKASRSTPALGLQPAWKLGEYGCLDIWQSWHGDRHCKLLPCKRAAVPLSSSGLCVHVFVSPR